MMAKDFTPTRIRDALRRAWRRVRWKIAAIVAFTGTSTILIVCRAIAALNVVVRRESANVVEKQIQVLVQASRSVAPAILDHAGACRVSPANSGGLKPLFAYTDEAFPQAQASLIVEDASGVRSLLPGPNPALVKHPDWLPGNGFTGLVVDRGQLEIRKLGSQLANWVSLGAVLALTVLLMDGAGVWMCIRLGSNIAITIDDLSGAARQIAGGNFAWRTPVRGKDPLGDLSCNFNEMVIALERLQKEEAAVTLVVDLFDANSKKLVWRGSMSDTLSDKSERTSRISTRACRRCSIIFRRERRSSARNS